MATDLTTTTAAGRALTFFALGGSGIRALEPILHLCALGLGPRQLKVVMIDPDQSNAAVTRSRGLMDRYCRIREKLAGLGPIGDGYFRTEVIDAVGGGRVVWSPISDSGQLADARFAARIDRERMTGEAQRLQVLADLLYSERIRGMDLTLGFRGVPSIGTVFMNRLRDESFFEQLLTNVQVDADATFFSIGSIFGGTGAAAFPVVGRVLVTGLKGISGKNDVPGVHSARVGGALLLPYFTLPVPASSSAPDGGIRPEASLFAQNAAAAIPTYLGRDAGYGAYYVLGDSEPSQQPQNSVGGNSQDNPSHYVEFMAALAALDFSARGGETSQSAAPVFRISTVAGSDVQWTDLPINELSRDRLMGGLVAAHTFLTAFRPDGKSHPDIDRLLHAATWTANLEVGSKQIDQHSALLDDLGAYFLRLWQWSGELGAASPSLALTRNPGQAPSRLRNDEAIDGRRPARRLGPTSDDGNEVFRHWNVASSRHRKGGMGAFLRVMREGSEGFARERFSEAYDAS